MITGRVIVRRSRRQQRALTASSRVRVGDPTWRARWAAGVSSAADRPRGNG